MPRVLVTIAFDNAKFECQRCGSCCHHRRPQEFDDLIPMELLPDFWEKSNLIYLTEKDIEIIKNKTGLTPKDFVDTLFSYESGCVSVRDNGRKVVLDFPVMRSKNDTTCIFFKAGCTIYPIRPMACRLFPFRVEEKSTPLGDIVLKIGYNPNCPGIGKGKIVEKKALERLVVGQFLQRSESIAKEVQELMANGKIQANAQIFRTLPGRRSSSQKAGSEIC